MAVLCAGLPLSAPQADPGEAGQRIYREGILPSGRPVLAQLQGDVTLRGRFAACVRCHRRSGQGWSESEVVAPAITGPTLFRAREDRRADLLRKIYQEVHGPETRAAIRTPDDRPAYDPESLAKLLRDGIAAGGRRIGSAMPRYRLAEPELSALSAYLQSLGSAPPPGIDRERIRFASVIAGAVDPDRRRAMVDVIEAFVRHKNREVERELARPGFSPYYKDHYREARRIWQVDFWHLQGGPETWRAQLEARGTHAPVFALLGGLAAGDWAPIHEFCERRAIPCLFPSTEQPKVSGPNSHTLYLSKGLVAEAQALARWLQAQPAPKGSTRRIVQVYRAGHRGQRLADAFTEALAGHRGVRIFERPVETAEPPDAAFWARLGRELAPTSALIWLDHADLGQLGAAASNPLSPTQLYFSGGLLASDPPSALQRLPARSRLTYPFALAGEEAPRIFRLRAWLRARGIRSAHERIQLNTYFALSVTEHALVHMVDRFAGDYLIERIEHETESALNPGTFPRMSLGPGQRFASRGSYIVALEHGATGLKMRDLSGWIVP